jgi:hypothetical protein
MLLASHFQLGTHFDNSGVTQFTFAGQEHLVEPRSWGQYRVLIVPDHALTVRDSSPPGAIASGAEYCGPLRLWIRVLCPRFHKT